MTLYGGGHPHGSSRGFTLLECMIALLLVSTALIIVVEAQSFAVDTEQRTNKINTASMLARDIFTELELRMETEGFGELEVKETGDFSEDRYGGEFEDYRWEYEVEKVELDKLPDLTQVFGVAGEGMGALADAAGVDTGGQAPVNELEMLGALGIDGSFISEMMGNYLRAARVRICFVAGVDERGDPMEDCIELVSHLVNPTGRVQDNTEEDDDDDAGTGGTLPTAPTIPPVGNR